MLCQLTRYFFSRIFFAFKDAKYSASSATNREKKKQQQQEITQINKMEEINVECLHFPFWPWKTIKDETASLT